MNDIFQGTTTVNDLGHLTIGGIDTLDLAKEYGTPVMVYDTKSIKDKIKGFQKTFAALKIKHRITYASKAFTSIAMYRLMMAEGICFEVVSGGELFYALKAGVPPENISFHGNNKTPAEIEYALEIGIGCFIVDNFQEIVLLKEICQKLQKKARLMIRVAPGIEAETHEYILTGQEDSKFGFDYLSGQSETALKELLATPEYFEILGVHCHIGSQIFATEGFVVSVNKMFDLLKDWQERLNFTANVLNIGGGFGVSYLPEEKPAAPEVFVGEIIAAIQTNVAEKNYPMPEIWIEPGRSLVAEAGTTLYTIGSRKDIPNVRIYLSVDGGMGDNIRPALYNAKYNGVVANFPMKEAEETVTVTGKYCESGYMLIWDLPLPKTNAGDILATFCTGAYGYSMASNYNSNPKPAVVFVEDGQSKLVKRRETYEDLVDLDVID